MNSRLCIFGAALLILLSACRQPTQHAALPSKPPVCPDWGKNAVLYECNVRQFSQEGNFQGVTRELPRLKELGVTVLWLMPIHPIGQKNRKGNLGSPYSVRDFRAINPDYGTAEDLKQLVTKAHELGIRVILDWVPNHTAWDAVWMREHPEYYTRIDGKFTVPLNERNEPIADWSDIVDLDYNNPKLRADMISCMQYWVRQFGIDGYRVDMAGLVPNDFWAQVRPALDSIKPVYMLSEWQDEPDHFRTAFDANYGWRWKDVTKDIRAGKQNAHALDTLQRFLDKFYPPGYNQLYFTQNHDENTWAGTDADLYGEAARAFAVLSFTWSGTPMIYNGQEDILVQQLGFFNRTPIQWKKYAQTDFYRTLSNLRVQNKALWSGNAGGKPVRLETDADDHVYAFYREKDGDRVLAIFNLDKAPRTIRLRIPAALEGPYADAFGKSTIQATREMTFSLKAWDYLVLTNK